MSMRKLVLTTAASALTVVFAPAAYAAQDASSRLSAAPSVLLAESSSTDMENDRHFSNSDRGHMSRDLSTESAAGPNASESGSSAPLGGVGAPSAADRTGSEAAGSSHYSPTDSTSGTGSVYRSGSDASSSTDTRTDSGAPPSASESGSSAPLGGVGASPDSGRYGSDTGSSTMDRSPGGASSGLATEPSATGTTGPDTKTDSATGRSSSTSGSSVPRGGVTEHGAGGGAAAAGTTPGDAARDPMRDSGPMDESAADPSRRDLQTESAVGESSSTSGSQAPRGAVGARSGMDRYSSGAAGYGGEYDAYRSDSDVDFQYRIRPDLNGGAPGNYSTLDPRSGASG